MHRFLILLLTCMSIALAFDSLAARPKRNAQSVKKERRLAAGELERTRKQINQNTAETKRQLNRLASLTADAERSNRLIDGLRREISDIDSRINALDDTIALMDKNLAALRESYAENLRSTRSRRQQSPPHLGTVFGTGGAGVHAGDSVGKPCPGGRRPHRGVFPGAVTGDRGPGRPGAARTPE